MNKKSILALSFSMLVLSNCVAPIIIGGGAAVGTMAMKDKGISGTISDGSINTAIDARLYQQSAEVFTQVDVDVYMGEVLLTGTVKQPEQSTEAEKIAWKAGGVRAVYNHINISENSSLPDYVSDTWVTTKIKSKLLAEKEVQSLNFFIKTVGGVVYIMGAADTEKEMELVKSLITDTNGVKEIICYAIIKEKCLMDQIQRQLDFFADRQKAGNLAPCWLLVGDRRLPKKEFAIRLAKQTLFSAPQQPHGMPDAFVAQHMDMNCYPNYLYVDRPLLDDGTQAADINIETTKRIADFVEKKPAVLGWRVVVIDAIDDMNRFGANSLLKTLEEPPHKTLFLIICHQQWHILPTIRSRCHTLNLNFLEDPKEIDPLQESLSAVIAKVLKGQTDGIETFAQQMMDTDKSLQTFFARVLMLLHQWCVDDQKPLHAAIMPADHWMNAYRAVNVFSIAHKDTHLNQKHVILATFMLIQNPDLGDFSQLM